MAIDVIPSNRGFGVWTFQLYNPSEILQSFKGYLFITKDHHTLFEDASGKVTLLSIPSQNVSYVKREDS